MAFISLGTINKKILFAVFGGISKLIVNLVLFHLEEAKMDSHPCILGINSGIGLCLTFIPFIYVSSRFKKNFGKKSSNVITGKILYNNNHLGNYLKRKNLKKYMYILIIAILDFSQKFLGFFYPKHYLENFWVFSTFFLLLFSYLILKTKVYIHHLVSIMIITIIGIILNVINSYDGNITFSSVVITLLTFIIYSLEIVVGKLTLNISSSYEICFYIGIFHLLIFSLLLIIFTNVPANGGDDMNNATNEYIDNFFIYIDKVDYQEVIVFIISAFGRCSFSLFGIITVDYFTPSHIILLLIIGEIGFIFEDEYDWKLYLKIFLFIFLLFFVLIFVEIIELNIFGLQKNTKKNITTRTENEDPNNVILDNAYYNDDINAQTDSDNRMQRFTLNENYLVKM